MGEAALFEGYEPAEAVAVPKVSAGRRLTQRQAEAISIGRHPLTGGPLHELASRHRDASSPKADPFTCGSCWFREVMGYHGKSYAKCWQGDSKRVTHSASTDVRAWWPACRDYSPSDTLSDDAARCIPAPAEPVTEPQGERGGDA